MRILFISLEEPFFLPEFFRIIASVHRRNVIGCILHPYRRTASRLIADLHRTHSWLEIIKLGTRYRPWSSVKRVMQRYRIPTYLLPRLSSPECTHLVRSLRPNIVIAQTNQIVPRELLSIPTFGWLNKHSSLLPKYRGLYPIFWALYNGEEEIGVTIHAMTEVLDQGPIFEQDAFPVQKERSVYRLYQQAFMLGARLTIKALTHPSKPRLRPRSNAKIYTTPSQQQIREFRARGFRLV